MMSEAGDREKAERERCEAVALKHSRICGFGGWYSAHEGPSLADVIQSERAQARREALEEAAAALVPCLEEDAPCDCRSNWNRAVQACTRAVHSLIGKESK